MDLVEISNKLGFTVAQPPSTLDKTVRVIKEGLYYLSDIGWDDLPDDCYLNKQTCGCGATHLAITNDVNYVIASPYVRLITNKVEQHGNIIAVHSTESDAKIKLKYDKLLSENKPIKFMTTYEGVSRLMSFDWFSPKDFKLMVDEVHDIVNFGLFRKEAVTTILSSFMLFKNYVFVTATPNKEQFLPKQLINVPHMELDWKSAKTVKINIQKAKKNGNDFIVEKCRQYLHGEIDGNAHIFYNSVKEIVSVIKSLKKLPHYDSSQIKVVCADNDYNNRTVKQEGVGILSKSLLNSRKINFYTACVFEGADIYDKLGRTYIVVNNKRNSTKLCMTTLVPQICGRIRDSIYNSEVDMLVCGDIDCVKYTRSQWFDIVINNMLEAKSAVDSFNYIKTLPNNTKILNRARNNASFDPYLLIDYNTGDIIQNEGALHAEMQRYDIIHSQYQILSKNEDEFKKQTTSLYETNIVSDAFDQLKGSYKTVVDKVVDFRVLMQEYISSVKSDDADKVAFLDDNHPMLKLYYEEIGEEKLKALKYRKKDVEDEYSLRKLKSGKFFDVIKNTNVLSGDIITVKEAKEAIQNAFLKVDLGGKVTAKTFEEYFIVEPKLVTVQGRRQRAYKVLSPRNINLLM